MVKISMQPIMIIIILFSLLLCLVPNAISTEVQLDLSPIFTIEADGTVSPPTTLICHLESDVYVLTANIASVADGIVIERDGILLDGQGHMLYGSDGSFTTGIRLSNRIGVTLRNLGITGYHYGIELDFSHHNQISFTHVFGNRGDGVFLNAAANNSIIGNIVEGNAADGIFLYSASNGNEIVRNLIERNGYRGIDLFSGCSGNIVHENCVVSNGQVGLYFSASSGNVVVHNNLVDNVIQAEMFMSQNVWYDAYPSGGNFWSDPVSVDFAGGVFQNQTGADGICDLPYLIDEDNIDSYPLFVPWYLGVDGEVNGDGRVDIYDAILLSAAFNTVPIDVGWDAKADLNEDGSVDIFDAIVLSSDFGSVFLQGVS